MPGGGPAATLECLLDGRNLKWGVIAAGRPGGHGIR